jgi:FkbM family methyltransferase
MPPLSRLLYHTAVALGRPIGGLRPRRIYDVLARRAFPTPEFQWFRNKWGHDLHLSPYYHIDRNILILGTYDADLHNALERLLQPGMTALDVGANLGEIALHMAARVGPTGQVHAFEPVPAIFNRLEQHITRNRLENILHPHPLALSDQTGQTEIAFADSSADNQGLASITNLTDKAGPLRTVIPTRTLDDFVQRERINRIDLIKIDIQGAEPRFLTGAQNTLNRLRPQLLMEFSPDDLRQANLTSRNLAQQLASLGYEIHPLAKHGPAPALNPATLPESFAAPNVLCTPKDARK